MPKELESLSSIRKFILSKIVAIKNDFKEAEGLLPKDLNKAGYEIEGKYQAGQPIEECIAAFEAQHQALLRVVGEVEQGPDAGHLFSQNLIARLRADAREIQENINGVRDRLAEPTSPAA